MKYNSSLSSSTAVERLSQWTDLGADDMFQACFLVLQPEEELVTG